MESDPKDKTYLLVLWLVSRSFSGAAHRPAAQLAQIIYGRTCLINNLQLTGIRFNRAMDLGGTDRMKMRNVVQACGLLAGIFLLFAAPVAAPQEPDVPVALLGTCVACHGADGIGKAPHYPNLAGQKAVYIEKQLKAFRSGERAEPNMSALAKPLSDDDISRLARYFESLGRP
jgi:cytochrome c553